MSRYDWIVCERSSRWASALRLAWAADQTRFRLREVRTLPELAVELAERPTSLAAIEVDRRNFADVLDWLASGRREFPRARCIALLDRSLSDDADDVCDALCEAGAQAIATSPRRLDAVLTLGQLHAATVAEIGGNPPLAAQVWASLPWQER